MIPFLFYDSNRAGWGRGSDQVHINLQRFPFLFPRNPSHALPPPTINSPNHKSQNPNINPPNYLT